MPPFTFTITPPYWGESQSTSYLRSVWRVQSANGSLQPGDPVSVEASIALDGTLGAPWPARASQAGTSSSTCRLNACASGDKRLPAGCTTCQAEASGKPSTSTMPTPFSFC